MPKYSNWFRFYEEAVDDPKVQGLSDKLFKFWVNCLCLASRNKGILPKDSDIAWSLRMTEQQVSARLTELLKLGLLDDTPAGLSPHNWNNRQFKSDVSTPRVARFRSRSRNVAETFQETGMKRREKVSETPSDTDTDTDTEAETDTDKPNAPVGAFPPAPAAHPKSKKRNRGEVEKALGMRIVWWKEFWSIFPCHEGGLPGMDAFERKVRDEETWRAVKAGAIRYRERANADPEMRLKYAQGWLNDERWTDEARPREPPRSASKIDQAMEIFEEKYSGLWPPTEIR